MSTSALTRKGKLQKKYIRSIVDLAWPSILENLATTITSMLDTVMVSPIGPAAVAAIGLSIQPVFLLLTPVIATYVAVAAIVARRKGAEDQEDANRTLVTALAFAFFVYLCILLIVNLFADPILRFMGSSPDYHATSVLYFRILMSGSVFNILAMMINASQSGSGNTRIAFVSNIVMAVVNISGNWLFITGNLGFPALGVPGAAVSSVLSQAAALCVSVASLYRTGSFPSARLIMEKRIRPARKTLKSIAEIGVTIFLENLFMRIGFIVTAVQAASLGTGVFAAHNAGMNLLNFGFSLANGMQTAAVASTGSALGAGDKQRALDYGAAAQAIGIALSILWSLALFAFGRQYYGILFKDPHLVETGVTITHYLMLIVLLQIQQIIYAGALRAAGDVRYTLIASTVSVTLIRTLVTILLVSVFHLGVHGIWLGILSHQLAIWIFMMIRFRQGKWVDLKI